MFFKLKLTKMENKFRHHADHRWREPLVTPDQAESNANSAAVNPWLISASY